MLRIRPITLVPAWLALSTCPLPRVDVPESDGPAAAAATAVPRGALLHETFDDPALAARGWYDQAGVTLSRRPRAAGGAQALEAHFPRGSTTPSWRAMRHLFDETDSVYLRYWVKYSSNWVGSGRSHQPHEIYLLTNQDDAYVGPSFTHLTVYIEHNYQGGAIPVIAIQDGLNIDQSRVGQDLAAATEHRAVAGCNGEQDARRSDCYRTGSRHVNGLRWKAGRPYRIGAWHLVEAFFQLNSIRNGRGLRDGIARYWLDGELLIDQSTVLFRTGAHADMKFNQLLIAPYIGDGSPVSQTMWIDELTLATRRTDRE